MPDTRSGHHGNVSYVFEDAGFDTEPTDTTFKGFGGNATLDTFEGSHEAVRVFNAERTAADIVKQVFDGAWSVTHEIVDPLWYLAGIYGQPSTSNPAGEQYVHTYDLANDADPVSLRLYLPTDGFNDYKVIPGAVVASVSVDQSQPGNPEVTVSGAYAREPFEDNTLSPTVPDFSKTSFTNCDGEVQVDGQTVGRAQNTTVNLEANTEMISEIGACGQVDFSPRAFNPEWTHDKILWVGQDVDFFTRFKDASQVTGSLIYDNGETGDAQYATQIDVADSYPNSWSESGRNDPDADLTEELQEMGQNATVEITVDISDPPGTA
jgi:hypothetical protein